jgi:hypothetical protein
LGRPIFSPQDGGLRSGLKIAALKSLMQSSGLSY